MFPRKNHKDKIISKITDFGLSSCDLPAANAQATQIGGTPRWIAPELLDKDPPKYQYQCDVWSFALTVQEVRAIRAFYFTASYLL